MARLSCAVMAHPARRPLVAALVGRLGGHAAVAWDRYGDIWDTARRAWHDHDPHADWHLVIQDDAVVCRDLLAGLAVALDHVPLRAVVSLCAEPGAGATTQRMRNAIAVAGRRSESWMITSTIVGGVALAAPTASIAEMLARCDRLAWAEYDRRVGRYYQRQGWPAWFPFPPLVAHNGEPSLLDHPETRSLAFIGADRSALDVDWSAVPHLAAVRC